MKKLTGLFFVLSLALVSCEKESNTPLPETVNYQPLTAGSTWNYRVENKLNAAANFNFTLTATNRDSTVNGNSFRVFTNSSGGNEYYRRATTDFYQYGGFAGLTSAVELLFLKGAATAGAGWTETKNVTVSGIAVAATFNYTIQEVLPTYTVDSKTFVEVLKVKVGLVVPGVTFTAQELEFYYAKEVGRIKSQIKIATAFPPTNVHTETYLTSYNIK